LSLKCVRRTILLLTSREYVWDNVLSDIRIAKQCQTLARNGVWAYLLKLFVDVTDYVEHQQFSQLCIASEKRGPIIGDPFQTFSELLITVHLNCAYSLKYRPKSSHFCGRQKVATFA